MKVEIQKVPVPIPCVSASEAEEMVFPKTHMIRGVDPEVQIKLLEADLADWKDYGVRVDAIIRGCRKNLTEAKP